jgi:hypothetical protein
MLVSPLAITHRVHDGLGSACAMSIQQLLIERRGFNARRNT